MDDLYPKVEKKIKGPWWLIALFIIIMSMWAGATFFEPVWDKLMEIFKGR